MAHNAQRLDLLRCQPPWFPVDQAKCADDQAAAGHRQRHGGVKADVRSAGHQRIAGKPRVRRRVRNDEQIRLRDGVRAKGDIARGLGQGEPDSGFEPVAVRVHQAYQRDRRLADLRGQTGEVVERFFRRRVQDVVRAQRL